MKKTAKTPDYLSDFTRLPKCIVSFCGFGSPPNSNVVLRTIYNIYSLCVLGFACFGVIRCFMLVNWSGSLDVKLAGVVLYLIWCVQAFLSTVFCMYNLRRGHCEAFEKVWRDGGTNEMVKKSNFDKHWYYWFVPTFAYVIVYVCANLVFAILPHFDLMTSPWPENFFPIRSISPYYFAVHCFVGGSMWVVPQYWYFVVCILTRYAWTGMCIRIERSASEKNPDGSCEYQKTLCFLTHQHRQLTLVVAGLNRFFGWYVLGLLSTGIPVIILQLYLAASFSASPAVALVMLFWLVGNLLQVLFVFSATHINTAADGVADALYNRYIEHYEAFVRDNETEYDVRQVQVPYMMETSILLEKLYNTEIKLTACGWFDVTKSFFATLVGVLITYYLVLLQFAQQSSNLIEIGNGMAIVNGSEAD